MLRPKIVTIRHDQKDNMALIKALMDRNVDLVIVGSRQEALGSRDVAMLGTGSHLVGLATALTMDQGPLGLDSYKLEQPKEFKLTAPMVLEEFQYNPSLPEPKNFLHQAPPVAKKRGNNRKRTKYRK
jgi:hypothetical protein